MTLRPESALEARQITAINHLASHKSTILVSPTGSGKTAICLSAIKRLTLDRSRLSRVIVACPAKVLSTNTWTKEQGKWSHLKHLKVAEIHGDPTQRLARMDHHENAHVWIISLGNLEWLLSQKHGANGIIVDELSKASGKQTRRMNTKRWGSCFDWRVGMTATPVSQDFMKLFYMVKRIDGGKALGTNFDDFRHNHFTSDYMGFKFEIRPGAAEAILLAVAKLVYLVEDTKEAELPKLTDDLQIRFQMPERTREVYTQMKRDMLVKDVEAVNEAVKYGKLRQIASGFLYGETATGERTTKWSAVEARSGFLWDWIVSLKKDRGVIFYEYEAQLEIIEDLLRHKRSWTTDTNDFLAGTRGLLVAQINSVSHGVDGLQDVCHKACFYHPMWSRDATEQAVGRLWRKGQQHPVEITTLICEDTLDDLVLERVEGRGEWMKIFTAHLKEN
tara:strand:- start:57 stop:1397 length:1341 start_codon:yes stop_codon:yes gene_type:complete